MQIEWIKKIAPTVGLVIGIVFVAIGAIVSLQAVAKLLFTEPDLSYIEDNCTNRYGYVAPTKVIPEGDVAEERMTEEELQSCIENQTMREEVGFKNRHIDGLITGLSMLIVGMIFWALFREKKK